MSSAVVTETEVLANQKTILQNQSFILKNQEEIKKNQLNLIVKNQEESSGTRKRSRKTKRP